MVLLLGHSCRRCALLEAPQPHLLAQLSADKATLLPVPLVPPPSQIKHCDSILEHMEGLLGKFQADLGQVSEEIRALQVRPAAACKQLQEGQAGAAEG
jgi:hypothetical protein